MTSYTLNGTEAGIYDDGDDVSMRALLDSIADRFGPRDDAAGGTEVYHPDGYVIGRWGSARCHVCGGRIPEEGSPSALAAPVREDGGCTGGVRQTRWGVICGGYADARPAK